MAPLFPLTVSDSSLGAAPNQWVAVHCREVVISREASCDLDDDDDGFFIDNISIINLVQCAMCTPRLALRRSAGMMLNITTSSLP